MVRRVPEETVDRTYALTRQATSLCLSVAREAHGALVIALPARGVVSVGRDVEADLCIGSPSLSRLHFAVEAKGEATTVRDLGSRNGTLLDGAPIGDAPTALGFGAEILAGDVRFSVLRRTSLPHAARPFLLLAGFEAAWLASPLDASPPCVAAIELAEPLNLRNEAIELFAQLPHESLVGLVSDDTALVSTPDPSAIAWLLRGLAQRGVGVKRHAVAVPSAARRDSVVAALLRELGSPAPAASEGAGDDVPPAFRYPSLQKIHEAMRRIAPRPISVLITGETGTGKEVLAREIHRLSRRTGPLVAVNTAALPEALVESELFGHERGAFSGAQTAKAGLIETADKGTLFLDEIGELPLPLQAKLLRVLEDQCVRRVGANTERKVDLRIVSATHQDLEALAREKRFRQDLVFRLNGASVALPPLRERRGEVAQLARQLLADLSSNGPPSIEGAALAALEAYAWPGNVRELKHVLEHALAFADGGSIALDHLPPQLTQALPQAVGTQAAGGVRSSVRDFERERIVEALRESGGNRTRAAELLGLPRRTLVYKLSRLGITNE
jgi:two-component system, NtrC family, response regulator AtoC